MNQTISSPRFSLSALLLSTLVVSSCVIPAYQPTNQQPAGSQPSGGQPGYASTNSGSGSNYSSPEAASSANNAAPVQAAPVVVSVTLRNTCSNTVRVFYGDKPKFGSGTTSSLSGNSSTSRQMKPGEMVWIVDESDNGLASATVSASTRTIEVTSSCTGLTSR